MIFNREHIEEICFQKLREDWLSCPDTFPDFLTPVTLQEQRKNEEFLQKKLTTFHKLIDSYQKPLTIQYFWKRKWNRLITQLLIEEPILGIANALPLETIADMRREFTRFMKAASEFDSAMTMEEIGQAARNYLVYDVFCEIHGQIHHMTPAILGYSMLYPYTDNYIDAPDCSPEKKKQYNDMISNHLQEKETLISDEYEKKTCELLDYVTNSYEQEHRRDIQTGLLLMLDAQKESMQQIRHGNNDRPVNGQVLTPVVDTSSLTAEEIFNISSYKGGISVLIDRFYVPKEITDEDFAFYLGYGFFLQLADDLQDITEDKSTGRQTLFTEAGSIFHSSVEQTLNRLFHYLNRLLSSYELSNESLKNFIKYSCFLLLIYSAFLSQENFDADYLKQFEPFLPLSFAFMESHKKELSSLKGSSAQMLQNFPL